MDKKDKPKESSIRLDRKKFQSVLGIVLIGITFYWALNHINDFLGMISYVSKMMMPFILGGSIAFILNIPVSMIESWLSKQKWSPKKYIRTIALLATLVIFVLALMILFVVVIPELVRSFDYLFKQVPDAFDTVQQFVINLMNRYPDYKELIDVLNIDYANLSAGIIDFMQNFAGSIMSSAVGAISSLVNGMMSLFIGFTFSIYIIYQKESLGVQSRKIAYALLPEHVSDYCVRVAQLTSTTFTNFVSGQGLEAIILGAIFFVAMSIFRMPYAMLISVIIGVTSIVPIFGAMFGSFIGVFFILLVDPWMALWFFIMFQIIQQLENNFIYPHVVGKSVGLPSIWVLFSLTMGGKLMGLVGMIISIPVFSIMYVLLSDFINKRLKKKNVDPEKFESEGPLEIETKENASK